MSVLLEFSMFPTDSAESKSAFVSKIIDMIDRSGVAYQLTPMGTIIETETLDEALALVSQSYLQLENECNRVFSSLKIDIRKNSENRLLKKVASVEKKIGREVKK